MNKIILALFLTFLFLGSCVKDVYKQSEKTISNKLLLEPTKIEDNPIIFHNINCYIFKDNIFYKALHNITLEDNNHITVEAPINTKLYFLTNIEEPTSLASLKEGESDISSFLSMCSNDKAIHSYWEAPLFYSGKAVFESTSSVDSKILLFSGVSQIDIDASCDEMIHIDSIVMNGASSTTQLFETEYPVESINKQNYLHQFKPSASGILTNVFRPYESTTLVNFIIKGTYSGIPIVINKSITKLERNKTYTLKIEEKDIEILTDTKTHIITPDSRGRLDMTADRASQIPPGSTIYLKGSFLSLWINGLKGNAHEPIRITNFPGKRLVVGDPNWVGGAYSSAIQLLECQHIILGGENDASDFIVEGSVQPNVQTAYFGVNLRPFTDNVEVKNMTIRNGGTGIVAKTDPEINDPKTWYPNSQLENLSIHNLIITGTLNEGMYIGHTAIWWGWDENGNGYNAGATDNPAHTYAQPIKWKNVKIYQNNVHNLEKDGIQASTMDQLEMYENEVANFGLGAGQGQCSGIIVGGRTTNTNTHDNYVHDGVGELIQFFGADEGNATHIIHNNLLVNTQGSGMGIYGTTDAATIKITNNTVVGCQAYAVQTNGRNLETKVKLSNNLFVSYYLKDPSPQKYIWIINGSIVEEADNKLFDTSTDAMIDPNNFYQPLPGSPIGVAGYRRTD